ncbi:translation elongation factor P [Neorickettsia helminthoeca str. Oregon]|uniref:Elongation factor P n=1 Tax=Neorickettsia helminthoeca str. Oregon TaxID=1286528 RepID=X5H363_9RICK|nr:elongation factor P [Neorickettsia helminthoeca]AHX11143.1 translation elongation factor P [Neorickettsia helminthoeca str. Oregon]
MSQKILGNDIKVGNILEHKNGLYYVLKREHVKPGKGGAFVNVEMKSIDGATKLNHRFRSEEVVFKAFIDEEEYQYLFSEAKSVILMNLSNYEQISIDASLFEGVSKYLKEDVCVKLLKHNEKVVGVRLKDNLVYTVEETEPYIKGQTITSSYKPATLNGGLLKVMVPPFIKIGDQVVVKTEDGTYVERAEK